MQQKMQMQEQELEQKQRRMLDEKETLKSKIEQLEKENARVIAFEDSHKTRALQYKN